MVLRTSEATKRQVMSHPKRLLAENECAKAIDHKDDWKEERSLSEVTTSTTTSSSSKMLFPFQEPSASSRTAVDPPIAAASAELPPRRISVDPPAAPPRRSLHTAAVVEQRQQEASHRTSETTASLPALSRISASSRTVSGDGSTSRLSQRRDSCLSVRFDSVQVLEFNEADTSLLLPSMDEFTTDDDSSLPSIVKISLDDYEATRGPRRPKECFLKPEEERQQMQALRNEEAVQERLDLQARRREQAFIMEREDEEDSFVDASFVTEGSFYEDFEAKFKAKKGKPKRGFFRGLFRRQRSDKKVNSTSSLSDL